MSAFILKVNKSFDRHVDTLRNELSQVECLHTFVRQRRKETITAIQTSESRVIPLTSGVHRICGVAMGGGMSSSSGGIPAQ